MGRQVQLKDLEIGVILKLKILFQECYLSESLYKSLKLDGRILNSTINIDINILTLLKAVGNFDDFFPASEQKTTSNLNSNGVNLPSSNTKNITKINPQVQLIRSFFSNYKIFNNISINVNKIFFNIIIIG